MSPEDAEGDGTGDRPGGVRGGPVVGGDGAVTPVGSMGSAGPMDAAVAPSGPGGARWAWDGGLLPVSGPVAPGLPAQRSPLPDPLPVTASVRPYVVTGGRTRARLDLSLETLVATRPVVIPYQLPHDEAAVLELCRAQTRSVAEVAALHRVPIGVAKVVVADLAEAGLVTVHRSFAGSGPDLALIERVLGGLRRI
jgi:hypothetical protein